MPEATKNEPTVLTIGGTDGTGGAGIQADLRTFAALGVRGLSVITAVVAQNDEKMFSVQGVGPAVLRDQLEALKPWSRIDAVKTGMLYDSRQAEVVSSFFKKADLKHVVVDSVLATSSGGELITPGGIEVLLNSILPQVTLVTPNIPESIVLSDGRWRPDDGPASLARYFPCPVLLKGGHGEGGEAVDHLLMDGKVRSFTAPRIPGASRRGTGCRLASAIAATLAKGGSLQYAIGIAKTMVHEALSSAGT